ncbi:MAG: thiol:disulfide interchange protein DsbA/DsbL [Gammaproteobacteria bacterium]|nr:thiol:disulfide interchange protein DsbA/DsbL [Gammaproteobacteria bacterium]MCP4091672.1 thiol:disulfide interchange protein DsbA/DsbL [Gammaproteobacteria bacterium]MCP4831802.1 thiol:disulfide interchange protein DsbA/DsbL [Gammaproteobacteria bacterium]
MRLHYLLLTFMIIALGACESPEQTTEDKAPTIEIIEEPATEVLTEEEVAKIEALNTAGETEETIEKEQEIVLAEPESANPQPTTDWTYAEGDHYRRMTVSQRTSSTPDKIEVAEVFWYGCPHCYDFDPILQDWKQSLGPDVSFVRIPVIWNPTNEVHARIMYTAEALGKLDEMHKGFFNALHQEGNTLTTEAQMVDFFSKYGVSEAEFLDAYSSFGVSSAVKRAENLTRSYGIRSVPVMVINGKYATDGSEVRSFGDVIGITNELVERERLER